MFLFHFIFCRTQAEAERAHYTQRRMWIQPTVLCATPSGEATELTMIRWASLANQEARQLQV
jgi:hypothetical protein